MESLKLEYNWSTEQMCHLCAACKSGPLNYACFDDDAPYLAAPRSSSDYMNSAAAAESPVTALPGFHLETVVVDVMHAVPLGIGLFASGSTLLELCREGRFGLRPEATEWKDKLNLQLDCAYQEFRRFCRARGLCCSQPRFTSGRLSMLKKKTWPMLKAKAWNNMCVLDWLACVASETAGENEYHRDRAAMLWGFSRFHGLLRGCGTWLGEADVAALTQARNAMLRRYNSLALVAAEDGLHKWPMKSKHHMLDHCVRTACATRLNPANHWSFAEEDNVGFIGKISAGCHDLSLASRVLERWALQFFADL